MRLMTPLARDGYTNILKRANINPLKISENMNQSASITKILHYLDQFEQEDLDDVNEVVI